MVRDVNKIRDIMKDPKLSHDAKKQKITEEYAILFNRIRAYLYTSKWVLQGNSGSHENL